MKIQFIATGIISPEKRAEQVRHALSLGLPPLGRAECSELAIVGGGNSVREKVETLRQWKGAIWAINGAWKWCDQHGIDATLFSIDPQECLVEAVPGVRRALLASLTHPAVFAALKAADVHIFNIGFDGYRPFPNGPTSATTAPFVALEMGYRKMTFFGCEGSYDDIAHSNAYEAGIREHWLKVSVRHAPGAIIYLTDGEFLMQSEILAHYVRAYPQFFSEESGGLLRHLVAEPEWDAIEISPRIRQSIEDAKAAQLEPACV